MKIVLKLVVAVPNGAIDTPPIVNGDVLTYRGQQYDLSQLSDGAQVEADAPFDGVIKRVNGQVELALEYLYSTELAEPDQPSNIEAHTFIVENGQCPDPIVYKPEPIVESEVESEI